MIASTDRQRTLSTAKHFLEGLYPMTDINYQDEAR